MIMIILNSIVRKMAGLDKGKKSQLAPDEDEEEEQQRAQTEAWEAILAKQQKKSSASSAANHSRPRKKTWLNRSIWKTRRKGKSGTGSRKK